MFVYFVCLQHNLREEFGDVFGWNLFCIDGLWDLEEVVEFECKILDTGSGNVRFRPDSGLSVGYGFQQRLEQQTQNECIYLFIF